MNASAPTVWDVLGIAATGDEREIKRAYARLLKANRPDDDPDAFQALRDSYEFALQLAARLRDATVAAAPPVTQPSVTQEAAQTGEQADAPAVEVEIKVEVEPGLTLAADPARAVREADTLWLAFAAAPWPNPRAKLHALTTSEVLLNITAREAFEVRALAYCAEAHCADEVRMAFFAHFGWDNDYAHAAALAPQAAHEAMARHRAALSFEQFSAQRANSKILQCLMAERHPALPLRLADARFTRAIKAHIQAIRWRHPEMLHLKLNAEVFAWWENRAATKRYFAQTALHSFLAGLLLSALILTALTGAAADSWSGPVFWASQACAFSLFAWFALRPPQRLLAALDRFKEKRLDIHLHRHRYENRWQHGWVLPFAVLSPLIALPLPPLWNGLLSLGLLACLLLAVFAASAVLKSGHWLVILFCALATGALMMDTAYGAAGFLACFASCACGFILAMRGGGPFCAAAGLPLQQLTRVRVFWLVGCLGLYFCLDSALPGLVLTALTWLWCLAGLLLSRFIFSALLIWPALAAARFFAADGARYAQTLPDPHLSFLLPVLVVIALFMMANMLQTRRHNLYFS
jgi:hypothetical protein